MPVGKLGEVHALDDQGGLVLGPRRQLVDGGTALGVVLDVDVRGVLDVPIELSRGASRRVEASRSIEAIDGAVRAVVLLAVPVGPHDRLPNLAKFGQDLRRHGT